MSKRKICIDAGHYGKYNRSYVVPEYYESDMTWKLHLLLKKYLEQYGFDVITTRESQNKDLALYKRGAASKGCDLFISLHSNAAYNSGDSAEKKKKNEPIDRVDIYAPISGKGHDIARKMADCIVSVMGTNQGGNVKTRKSGSGGEYYGVIRGAVAVGTVGLLVEHSFHTNTRAAKWLLEESNLDKLAQAEARVLAEHFSMTGKPDAEEAVKPEADQAGKLGDRLLKLDSPMMRGDDVREMQERMNALGYSCGNADGIFGKKTEDGVKKLQEAADIAVDGIFGPMSLKALKAAESVGTAQKKTLAELADEVIDGKWGNGSERRKRLEAAGYNYREVQDVVNSMLVK